jgi:uncharacterized membrane protein YgcG
VLAQFSIDPAGSSIAQGQIISPRFDVYDPTINPAIVNLPAGTVGQQTTFDLSPAATGGSGSEGSPSYSWAFPTGENQPSTVSYWNISSTGQFTLTTNTPFPVGNPLLVSFTVTAGGVASAPETFAFQELLQPSITVNQPPAVVESASGVTVPAGSSVSQGQLTATAVLSLPPQIQAGSWNPAGEVGISLGNANAPCGLGPPTSGPQGTDWPVTCPVDTSGLGVGPQNLKVSFSSDAFALSASGTASVNVLGPDMNLGDCTVGAQCTQPLTAVEGAGATWKLTTSSQNADGLSVGADSQGNWALSGTPTKAQTSLALAFEVNDAAGEAFDFTTSLTVNPSKGSGGGSGNSGGGSGNSGGGSGNSGSGATGAISQAVDVHARGPGVLLARLVPVLDTLSPAQ